MEAIKHGNEKFEATFSPGGGYNRDISWVTLKSDKDSEIVLFLNEEPHNLVFLDQLRYAVDEAIKWAREDSCI